MSETIRAVDLFCGAGGLSWGLVEALEAVAMKVDQPTEAVLADVIDLVGVNHWERAIETHEANHPWARHFHDDVQNVDPRAVFEESDPDVTILSGGIECTHWSTARGGKPVDEQKRMPAWDFLTWVQKLRPENVLVENVKEFAKWGPIEDDGTPTRNGETFEQWVNSLHALGYSVDWQVCNAADYGDATSRERLFIMARREATPEFPEPTHSEDGHADTDEWRTAAEIIDWSESGESIWSRSRPLVENTMKRIAEGIRRHSANHLEPFADAIAELGKADVEAMQECVVPVEYAPYVAEVLEEPFLVAPPDDQDSPGLACPSTFVIGQHGGAMPRPAASKPVPTVTGHGYVRLFDTTSYVLPRNGSQRGLFSNRAYEPSDQPLHTVTAKNHDGHLVTPALMQFSHGGKLLDLDGPLPTITTAKGGVFAVADPYLVPFYGERNSQRPRIRDVDRPLSTVPASKVPAGVARPYLVQYHGQSGSRPIDEPTPTVTATDSLALCVPECYPWGLDVRFRMLQPRELAAAQGFPSDYEFAGTKTETVEQIGNAVPVNLARELVESLLESSTPALTDYFDDGIAVDETSTDEGGAPADD